jgi:flagella basal body P-ring formation protein FlgA
MRTTDLLGRVVVGVALAGMALAAGRAVFADALPVSPGQAIEQAVSRRLGSGVSVSVESVETTVAAEARLEALPEPTARTGMKTRFILSVAGDRRGIAVATVRASAMFPRAAHAIARGDVLTPELIDTREGELESILFKRLPESGGLVGLTARRNIAVGEPLTGAVVEVPAIIKSGDQVTVGATVRNVHATASGIASGSGGIGDTIQVLQRGHPRPIRVRITGPAMVEVIP